jgi:hypothetical protein
MRRVADSPLLYLGILQGFLSPEGDIQIDHRFIGLEEDRFVGQPLSNLSSLNPLQICVDPDTGDHVSSHRDVQDRALWPRKTGWRAPSSSQSRLVPALVKDLLDADHLKDRDELLFLLRQRFRKHTFKIGNQKLQNLFPERTEFRQASLVVVVH